MAPGIWIEIRNSALNVVVRRDDCAGSVFVKCDIALEEEWLLSICYGVYGATQAYEYSVLFRPGGLEQRQ